MFQISPASLQATTNCDKALVCLEGESEDLCKVELSGPDALFLKCLEVYCFYQNRFGGYIICTCPVRIEIKEKYGL